MNRKTLVNRLDRLGYSLTRDIFGWIVISNYTGFEWKFPTLGMVSRFVKEEESLRRCSWSTRSL